MARKKIWQMDVTGPAVAGALVGLGSIFVIGPFAPLAFVVTAGILVAVRYYTQPSE